MPRRARSIAPATLYFEALEPRALLALQPTAQEQYMLELLNRFRADPVNELGRLVNNLGTPARSPFANIDQALVFFNTNGSILQSQFSSLLPVAPLAWSEALYNAAEFHTDQQILYDVQTHQVVNPPSNPGYVEPVLSQRATNAGYPSANLAENVFAFTQDPLHGHAGFVLDWGQTPSGIQDPPGHRNNMMSALYREVGIRIKTQPAIGAQTGPLVVTQDFGGRAVGHNPFIVGVVYNDIDGDDFYTMNEGLGNVSVTVVGTNGTSGQFTTTSFLTGGWQISVPPGTYNVTFSGNFLGTVTYPNVVVGSSNVKLDAQRGDVPPAPVAEVKGNGVVIASGDTSPSQADHTGFGSANIQGQTITRTFTITNRGSQDLLLSGSTRVTLSGSGAAAFTVIMDAALGTLTPGQSTTFKIRFDPSVAGVFSLATVTLDTNDPARDSYTFTIQGKGIAKGIAELSGRGDVITNGDSTPSDFDGTRFGVTPAPGGSSLRTFTVTNTGAGTLTLIGANPISFTGPDAAYFSVAMALGDKTLTPGQSTTFKVRFSPLALGVRSAIVNIKTSDALNATYSFTVRGTGAPSPQVTVNNGAGFPIPAGDTTPSVGEKTDYGILAVGSVLTRWFTIKNTGTANLTLGTPGVTVAGGDVGQFKFPNQPAVSGVTLAPGQKVKFFVRFKPTMAGFFTTTVSVFTSDPVQPTYTFAIAGAAMA